MENELALDIRDLFYFKKTMPCCLKPVKFFEGPHGGLSVNIKCAHCGTRWNICPKMTFIEKI